MKTRIFILKSKEKMTSTYGTINSLSKNKESSINTYNDAIQIGNQAYNPVTLQKYNVSKSGIPLNLYNKKNISNPYLFTQGPAPVDKLVTDFFREQERIEYQKMLLENISVDFAQSQREQETEPEIEQPPPAFEDLYLTPRGSVEFQQPESPTSSARTLSQLKSLRKSDIQGKASRLGINLKKANSKDKTIQELAEEIFNFKKF